MNIAVNASIVGAKPTGLGVYTINLVNELIKIGKDYNITIFTSQPQFFKLSENVSIKLINDHNMKNNMLKRGFGRIFETNKIFSSSNKFNVYFNPTHHGSFKAENQVVTVHDLTPLYFPKQHEIQAIYLRLVLPKILRRASRIIAISDNTKRDIIKFFGIENDKVKTIYNGMNLRNSISNFSLYSTPYILFVGASYPHKNVENLIRAYAIVREKIAGKLIIVGGREKYLSQLKQVCIQQGLEKNVDFLGYVSDEELTALYQNAQVTVFPSLYEGFGFPRLEAMSLGSPTVVSNTSSLPEICGDASHYVDPTDIQSIADGILEVFNNEYTRARLIEKGKLNVKRFEWNKTAHEVLKVLEEASSGGSLK